MPDAGDGSSASAPPVVSGGGGGASSVSLVYPGSTKPEGRNAVIHDGGKSTKVDYYDTKDDGPAVAAWYEAHLPSDWERSLGAPGKKIAGTFSSPDQSQIVMVTGGPNFTEIQVSTELASK